MDKKFFATKLPYVILGLWCLLGLARLRYFVHSSVPLWYDPGMYKEIFSHYRNVLASMDFSVLPQRVRHEPLLWMLASLVHKLWVSYDRMLTRGIGIINIIPGLLIFWLCKIKSKHLRWWVFAALLYRTSMAQYQVFWFGYFKQTLAVSVMLLILILGEKKKIVLQSIAFFFLIILHKHTALYTWAILAISAGIERMHMKIFPRKKILYRVLAGIVALLIYIPLRNVIMTEAVKAVGDGSGWDFIAPRWYITYARPIILISLLGLGWRIKEKKFDTQMIWYGVGIIWIALSLVNYNRTLVFLDVFVVIFAAYFLRKICESRSSINIAGVSFFLIVMSGQYLSYIYTAAKPLISQEEFAAIQDISMITEPNALIMNSHRNYSPWIMGWSQRDYINPGMSDRDAWTHAQRNQRRMVDGQQKCKMLKATYISLARPVYLWIWSQQFVENFSWWRCFVPMRSGATWTLYKIDLQ